LPVQAHRHQREHTHTRRYNAHEVREDAVVMTEEPIVVEVDNKVEAHIEDGNRRIGYRKIEQEIVCHSAHPFVSKNDPNHSKVPANSDDDNECEHGDVIELDPPCMIVWRIFAEEIADTRQVDDLLARAVVLGEDLLEKCSI